MMFTLKKIAFVLACYARSRIAGRATRIPSNPKKVLVIQMAKIGDIICTTPVFRALKEHDPSLMVHVMGNRINKEVVAGNKDVDAYRTFDGFREAVSYIRHGRYDAVFIAGAPDTTSLAAALLAGAPCIVVPRVAANTTPLADVWYRLLSRLAIGIERVEGTYAPREYLRLLEPIGIYTEVTRKYQFFTREAEAVAERYLEKMKGKLIVGMTPSAGNKIKEWPPERFAAVAEYLVRAHGADVLVFGAKADVHEVDAMFKAVQNKDGIHNALNQFSIDELKAVISKIDLFISADTGPIYIAESFGIPTIDIVGPVDEREQPPQGGVHRVIIPPGRTKPQLTVMNAKWYDYDEARRQAEATPVEMVIEEIDSLIKEIQIHA